jgi:hypothetical protein
VKIALHWNHRTLAYDLYIYKVHPDGQISYATLDWCHGLPEGAEMLRAALVRNVDVEVFPRPLPTPILSSKEA